MADKLAASTKAGAHAEEGMAVVDVMGLEGKVIKYVTCHRGEVKKT